MNRKICVVSSSRADYGLLKWLMLGIKEDSELSLQTVVAGMHLSATFGMTYKEIEADGFHIDRKVDCLSNLDSDIGMAHAISKGIISFTETFKELKPDIVVLLGDRFEIFSAALAAHISNIPLAHIHGGEVTVGAIDEAFRHSITKMSQLHFVAAEDYRKRVIQLGEMPDRVFNVGGLGVENISKTQLISRNELEKTLNVKFLSKSLLITFHPTTLESTSPNDQFSEVLKSLSKLQDTTLIFTMPNADPGSQSLMKMVNDFVEQSPNAFAFTSLGYVQYLSCVAIVDGVVGNSSSGLLEVPSFKKGTINIGIRQQGRLHAASVLNCNPNEAEISSCLEMLYSPKFNDQLKESKNPYGDGESSRKIIQTLKSIELEEILLKTFNDL